ncbi:AarF/ABC1/UbiB kinase family protein [Desulforhopalus vacuolatus]|uniref:ABC1 kinase family protein n=1 Tax=Desulforhopalus vacuolatus TaxID=40414 RepID=UPI001963E2F8|nr:AarF/ABC1/UbiB kinase family protein [Desulforhopalus vacuolatus]MBM9518420.1 AarF/ABC1/UbiB kinase family protein [Desulforhopalus vacuolatus]
MRIPSIRRTITNTRRLAEIAGVLSRFGFQQLLQEAGIYRMLGKSKEEIHSDKSGTHSQLPNAVRVRKVLEELGPSFIKLGQILSTRPDLIPPEWANELKKLQTDCPRVPWSEISSTLHNEFPGGLNLLFASIDEVPLAAASIAQVHAARLLDGTDVVLKVLRPGVRQILEEDMSLVGIFAKVVEQYFSNLGYSPTAVVKEFSREILKEIDLVIEGQSADRMRHDFEDDPNVSFPKIYWETTTRNVLTMGRVHGQVLSSIDPATLSLVTRRKIVSIGTDAVFKQCLRFGFFHADPHPGNIFLLENGGICLIDCGMVGQIDKGTTDQLINLVNGVIRGDENQLCRVVLALTNADPEVLDSREFRLDLRHFISHFQSCNLKQLDITSLLSSFFSILQNYHIQCPGDLMLLTKALTTIEGVGEWLDPSFDILSHVEPLIREVIMDRYSFQAIRKRVLDLLQHSFELMEMLPNDLQRFLEQARHSRFTLNLELKRIEDLSERVMSASRLMGMAMIIAALFVGSSILVLADRISKTPASFISHLGIIGLVLATLFTGGFVISFLLPKKKEK